jgi:AcrR family transcriptional regulator
MPISDCQVRDPRIRRTRKLLQGALGKLMLTKSFDEISVHDIAEEATVNRATFYDHYTDKFALLNASVAGGFHEMLHERHIRYDAGCPYAVAGIIQATCDYFLQVHSGGACERQTHFEPLMDAAITAAIRHLLLEGLNRATRPSVIPPELVAAAASSAICSGVKQWLASPERPVADVVVAQLLGLVLPMLEATSTVELPALAQDHVHAHPHEWSPAPAK